MTTTDPKQPGINPQSKFNLGDTVLCLSDGLEWTVAGFTDRYVILGTHAHYGCIKEFADFITYDRTFTTYRFARPEKLQIPYTEGNDGKEYFSSWDEEFKHMNEILEKMKKTVASIYDSYGKMRIAVDKLNRL